MKIRIGFVSNSSSSSFVINLKDITTEQRELIIEHAEYGEEYGMEYTDWYWDIETDKTSIKGRVSMDNFDMQEYLIKIGVSENVVTWGDGY